MEPDAEGCRTQEKENAPDSSAGAGASSADPVLFRLPVGIEYGLALTVAMPYGCLVRWQVRPCLYDGHHANAEPTAGTAGRRGARSILGGIPEGEAKAALGRNRDADPVASARDPRQR